MLSKSTKKLTHLNSTLTVFKTSDSKSHSSQSENEEGKFIHLSDLYKYIQKMQKDNLDEDVQKHLKRANTVFMETFINYSYYVEKELQQQQDKIDSPHENRVLFSSS